MEEAAEAQEKICKMQYKQMEKADRDPIHALRAEDECRQLLAAVPQQQVRAGARSRCCATSRKCWRTRNTASALFYHKKGSFPAAANRLQGVADQFPLYSKADEALWVLADSYQPDGRPVRESAGRSPTPDRQGLPAERRMPRGQGAAEGDEAAAFPRPIRWPTRA